MEGGGGKVREVEVEGRVMGTCMMCFQNFIKREGGREGDRCMSP